MPVKHCIVLATFSALALSAFAHERDVHGEARLEVAIEQGSLELKLEMPLDSAVGFEHAPKNDQQKAALSETLRRLEDAGSLADQRRRRVCAQVSQG